MTDQKVFRVNTRYIMQSGIINPTLREWQGCNSQITTGNFMYPVFIIENDHEIQPISSMPGINRYGINKLRDHLEKVVENGLKSVLLFGIIEILPKNDTATSADDKDNPVIRAIPKLRKWFPDLTIACDVCLCPYSSHGHCAILAPDGSIDNSASLERISDIALSYAKAGAHIVAPSDMMDGRIGAIKTKLVNNNLGNKVAVLSYTAKFASNFYGPFRDAAKSKPSFGDRKCYQLPHNSSGMALRAADRDVSEGADMLMIKPVMAYMDILKQVKNKYPEYPMFVYQVSGEYAMIYNAAQGGAFDLKPALLEIMESLRRAGNITPPATGGCVRYNLWRCIHAKKMQDLRSLSVPNETFEISGNFSSLKPLSR